MIEAKDYKELVTQLIRFQENQVQIIQRLADLIPKEPSTTVFTPSIQIDPVQDSKINSQEASEFGGEMSEEELAKQFGEAPPKRQPEVDYKKLTLDDIKELESANENSNDIYRIKARVVNLARCGGATITPNGEIMVNSCVHVFKSLYDFAGIIKDESVKTQLISLVRKHENLPADIIAASGLGIKSRK